MGKDRSKDRDAATSSAENKDHSRDQESRDAVLTRTFAIAVVGALAQQKSEETQSITKAVAGALAKQRQRRHSQSQKHLQGKWRRHMCNMRSF